MHLTIPPDLTVEHWRGEPLPSLGPAGYGDWDQVVRSGAERGADRRWVTSTLLARRGGVVAGMLAVHRCRHASLPDANLRAAMADAAPGQVERDGADRLLFIGGHAGLRGGMAILAGDPLNTTTVAVALTRQALAEAAAAGARPVALWVPHDQVPFLLYGWQPAPRMCVGGQVAVLWLGGAATIEEFLASVHKDVRGTWRRDLRRMASAGLAVAQEAVSAELLAQAAPLIADVKVRNGTLDTARLTEYRLAGWDKAYLGGKAAWTVRSQAGDLLGVSLAEVHAGRLVMVEIGLDPGHPDRSLLYHQLGFHAPLRYALAHRKAEIDLGSGHPMPKRARGAKLTLQWHLTGQRPEPQDEPEISR